MTTRQLDKVNKSLDRGGARGCDESVMLPRKLELAFVMDCTESMGRYIRFVKENIDEILDGIGECDIRLGLVEFKDHPPGTQSFVTRSHDFTRCHKTLWQWLDAADASGGEHGFPEAVADAICAALHHLTWSKEATKICVLITDSIPHSLCPEEEEHNFKGCPKGYDPVRLVHQMADKGILLYCVGCEPSVSPFSDFYKAMALIAGGKYVPLRHAHLLKEIIVGGVSEELSLDCFAEDIRDEVEEHVSQMYNQLTKGQVDIEKLVEKLQKDMQVKGTEVTQFEVSANSSKTAITEAVQLMAKCTDLKSVRKIFRPTKLQRRAQRVRSMSYSPPRRARRSRSRSRSPRRRRSWSRSRSRSPRRGRSRSRSRSRSPQWRRSRSRSRSRSPRRDSRNLKGFRSTFRSRILSRSRSRLRSRSRSLSPEYCVVKKSVDSTLLRRVVDRIIQRM